MRALVQKVGSMPARAEWKEEWLTFKDRPGERHLVQFRDIIEAIRALLGNPAHAHRIVYRSSQLFSCAARNNHIYTEMWTGRWWREVQVRNIVHTFLCVQYLSILIDSEPSAQGVCAGAGNHFNGQDSTDSVLWQQVSVPGVHDSGQHT